MAGNLISVIANDLNIEDDFKMRLMNSGSDANIYLLETMARTYVRITSLIPHILISSIEDKSITYCLKRLRADKLCIFDVIPFDMNGSINLVTMNKLIRPNTILISITAARSEIGIITSYNAINMVTSIAKVPLHVDATQIIGRMDFKPKTLKIDIITVSCNKFGAPSGLGFLAIKTELLLGYKLNINRPGSLNEYAIKKGIIAYNEWMLHRNERLEYALKVRNAFKKFVSANIKSFYLNELSSIEAVELLEEKITPLIIWLEPSNQHVRIPHVISFAIYPSRTLLETPPELKKIPQLILREIKCPPLICDCGFYFEFPYDVTSDLIKKIANALLI